METSRKESREPVTRGFTVLELMMVISIAGILLAMGIPAFQDFSLRQRMSAAVDLLHTHLALARHEAVYRNAQVVVCPGDISRSCINSGDWSSGWLVFSDLNGDRQYQESEPLLRAETGLEQLAIHSSSGRPNLRFYPNGSAPGSNGSITFCDLRGPTHARKLVISNIGRIRRDEAPELDSQYCPSADG